MEAYAALGITKVFVTPRGSDPVAWVERFAGAVLPRLRELTP
jgi:hypothetical protein